MENQLRIGFIGFGEAAFHLSKGLRAAGVDHIFAYDLHASISGKGDLIRMRAVDAGVALQDSNAELARQSEIVFSTVTANQASAAAQQTAPWLEKRHVYADLNSVSPPSKQAIARIIEASGAQFVEVAVMAPVPPYSHKVPMLAGGPHSQAFAGLLRPFGTNIEVGDREIGVAAATKMCRSIMIKGLEALLTECVLGATKYHADERVFKSLGETFPGIDWPKLATYMVGRVVVHGERRAREMEEVVESLRAVGVDPFMAQATAERMDWSARRGLKQHFDAKDPASYQEFAKVVAEMAANCA